MARTLRGRARKESREEKRARKLRAREGQEQFVKLLPFMVSGIRTHGMSARVRVGTVARSLPPSKQGGAVVTLMLLFIIYVKMQPTTEE